jgi:hypothetical protein
MGGHCVSPFTQSGILRDSAYIGLKSYSADAGRDKSKFPPPIRGFTVHVPPDKTLHPLADALNLFEKDKFSAQVTYCDGVARYVNDLSGEHLDAALDGRRLEAIPVFAAMAGYTYYCNDVRSCLYKTKVR